MALGMKPGKRIIVACDGTWLSADNGYVNGRLAIDSNVTRFCRALLPADSQKTTQVIYYQAGLGSEDNIWSKVVGGYLGQGFCENVREAYCFICNNWVDGDEIYLLGFSRGAFIARTVCGLINSIGLLNNKGLVDVGSIFKDWENQYDPSFVNPVPSQTFGAKAKRPTFQGGVYMRELQKAKLVLSSSNGYIPITAVGIWDAVGSLGLPDLSFLPAKTRHEFSFINTEVAPNVMNAFQVLALDEHRKPFSPTVWESPKAGTPNILQKLKQTWFPGVHSNVGNAYPDAQIGDLTLAWMIDSMRPLGLAFDDDFLRDLFIKNADWVKQATGKPDFNLSPRNYGWAMGKLYSNDSMMDYVTGRRTRTPGQYHWTDPATGLSDPKRMLVDTQEYIHPCVRVRKALNGLGVDNSASYEPAALAGWRLYEPGAPYKNGPNPWKPEEDARYKYVLDKGDLGKPVYICEDVIQLGGIAATELERWPDAKKAIGQGLVS